MVGGPMSSDYPERERYYPEMFQKKKSHYPETTRTRFYDTQAGGVLRLHMGPPPGARTAPKMEPYTQTAHQEHMRREILPGSYPETTRTFWTIMLFSSVTNSNTKRIIKPTTTNYTLTLVKPTYRRTKTAYPEPEHPSKTETLNKTCL